MPVGAAAGAVAVPGRADAWIVTALQIGAAVFGAMAAANASDGGVSGYLVALNQKVDLALDKLDAIQRSLADLQLSVASIPEDVINALMAKELGDMHEQMRADIRILRQIIEQRPGLTPVTVWVNDENVKFQLRSLQVAVSRRLALLIEGSKFDPITAFNLVNYSFMVASLYTLLKYDRETVQKAIELQIMTLESALDPNIEGSSSSQLNSKTQLNAELEKQLAAEYKMANDANSSTYNGVFRCVGVDVFTKEWEWDCQNQQSHPEQPCDQYEVIKEGPKERRYSIASVKRVAATHKDSTTGETRDLGFYIFEMPPTEDVSHSAGTLPQALDCNWDITRQSIPDEAQRIDYLNKTKTWENGQKQLDSLRQLVSDINVCRAQMMVAAQAIIAANRCIDDLRALRASI